MREAFQGKTWRAQSMLEAFRYGIVGIISFAANIAIVVFLVERIGMRPSVGAAISLSLVFFVNFFLARYVIFLGPQGPLREQFVRYGFFNMLGRVAEYGMFFLLLMLGTFSYTSCLVAALLLSNIVKFGCYKSLVFTSVPESKTERMRGAG